MNGGAVIAFAKDGVAQFWHPFGDQNLHSDVFGSTILWFSDHKWQFSGFIAIIVTKFGTLFSNFIN